MDTYHGLAELEAAVGQDIGPTDWFLIDQARVDGFADDTEDHQWIHVDPWRLAAEPFGGPVAHEVEGGGEPACLADMVSRYYFDAPALETSGPAAGE